MNIKILCSEVRYCSKEKELEYGWVIMTNHVHMIVGTRGRPLSYIMRDLKKFTSIKIIEKIKENGKESRAQWMLRIFEWAGKYQ
jgi:REP element-mobilizing transposase RayT